MEEEIIKNYWKKKHYYRRIGDEIINIDKISKYGDTTSLANVCKKGDMVNGDKVIGIMLGMGWCYCVVTEKGHTYYSWNIKSIKTKKKRYEILDTEEEVLLIERNGD